MDNKQFLKKYPFIKCLRLKKEEIGWLHAQALKVANLDLRYGLLLEFFINCGDEGFEFASDYLLGSQCLLGVG